MIDKKEFFKLEPCPGEFHNYSLRMNFEELGEICTVGSYNILGARLMNMSWPDYLRFCRDALGAEIIGKNSLYPAIKFHKNPLTYEFVRMLNLQMNLVVWMRQHPDWREHQELLKQYEQERELKNADRKAKGLRGI